MCRLLLPRNDIARVKYFTARVGARPGDPDQPTRQEMFLRALRTLPDVEIIFGHFLTNEVILPVASPSPSGPRFCRVVKTEEKGSDVNIATHLLRDGFTNQFDVAILVTNDSDLLGPIQVVRSELHKAIGILNPHAKPSRTLQQHASFMKPIRKGVLAAAQFPTTLHDAAGVITKPARW